MSKYKIYLEYMVCSFVEPSKIKEWIEICTLMKTIDSMVCLTFSPTHLTIQMSHPSRKCILDMSFPSTWFSDYDFLEFLNFMRHQFLLCLKIFKRIRCQCVRFLIFHL